MRAPVLREEDGTDIRATSAPQDVRRDGPDVLMSHERSTRTWPVLARHRATVGVPPVPRPLLRRQRLLDAIDEHSPVTALIAPAGTGKTTLLAEWAADQGGRVAWVDGAAEVDGPVGFWVAVAEAVERLWGIGASVRRDLVAGRVPVGDAALHLVEELAGAGGAPGAIVVDDLHVVLDDAVAASLGIFLRHLPPGVRVLLSSRAEPGLALDRLRAGGVLNELRFGELRFSVAESVDLLAAVVDAAPAEDLQAAAVAADGWAVALRLAAIEMRLARRRPPGAAGSDGDHHVDEYVHREVLSAAPPELVGLLQELSVVERFTGDLAIAISGRQDVEELLEQAETSGLMVSRTEVYGWYVIHSVVRAVLLNELTHRDPQRAVAARTRAATWLAGAGETSAAIDQWVLAGQHREVLRLLALHHVELYDAGGADAIRDIVARLAPETTAYELSALLELGWCQLLTSRTAFLDCVDQAEWWVANREVPDDAVASQLDSLRAIACLLRGDWAAGAELARRGLDGLDEWWADPVARTGWNNVGRAIALGERWDDAADEVREMAVALRREPNRLVVLEATRSLGESLAGRPVDALRVAAGVRSSSVLANLVMSKAELALAEAVAHREMADDPGVGEQLDDLLHVPIEPLTYVRGLAGLELVQLHLDAGDQVRAGEVLTALDHLVRTELTSVGGHTMLGRANVALHLARGDAAAAAAGAAGIDDPFWGPACRAQVHLADGDRAAASDCLDAAVPRSSKHEVVLALRRATAAGDREAAVMWAGQAVTRACADGMLQTVASEHCLPLVEPVAWRVPAAWMDRLRRLVAGSRRPGVPPSMRLLEPLTERERDVLRFLPSRLTLGEIAGELYVSVNTLKFHLRLIYRKLGVNSRHEAAEFARSWASHGHRGPG